MAPLTRSDKYHDLIRLSAEPSTLLNKLSDTDLNDVENQRCPLILRSITSSRGEIRVHLARNLRIDFPFYSKISREYRREFPERLPTANRDDPVLHRAIQMNDKNLTIELFKRKVEVNAIGELGTPLITALHFDVDWAVELLLQHGADLTARHVDWPHWTIYQYCIQFGKIKAKVLIEKHLISLIQQKNESIIEQLNRAGWQIEWRRFCQRVHRLRINSSNRF